MNHPSKRLVLVSLLGVLLAGCGDKQAAAPTAAKVNGQAIGVAELDDKMKQYSHLPEEGRNRVTGKMLKAMVDSELLRQAAVADKLDADPAVRNRLVQANRLILANAYVEKQRAAVPKPTAAEVKAYFDQHPEQYSDRKLYDLQELVIQPKPVSDAELLAKLDGGRKFDELVRWLAGNKFPHGSRQQVVAPDNMPDDILLKLYKTPVGGAVSITDANQISILRVNKVQAQPVALEQAASAIESKLWDQRKAEAMEAALKQLREKAKVEYVAPYSESGPTAVQK